MIVPETKKYIRQLKARDVQAFERLIEAHQARVFNLIFRILGNREEAEDLLQEVFITVFKKIGDFRGDASLSTWIYRIATNHCINRKKYLTRREHYSRKSYQDIADSEQSSRDACLGTSVPRPDEMAEGFQMEREVQRAITRLDEEYRVVLVLRDIQNLSYEEIEHILGIPSGTVKSRLHRARMILKETLAHYAR